MINFNRNKFGNLKWIKLTKKGNLFVDFSASVLQYLNNVFKAKKLLTQTAILKLNETFCN